MAKMLGQDLFTQEEFDTFKDEEFSKIVVDLSTLNEKKADADAVQSVIDKLKKSINNLYVLAGAALLGNIGLLYYVSVLLKH